MATTEPAAFIAEVRAEMARQGLAQVDLASRVHMTPVSVHRRLTGKSPLSMPDAYRIADALGVPLHELAARAEQAAPAL